MSLTKTFALTAAASLIGTSAIASTVLATATTDLNLRTGPGPNYEIVDVIESEDVVQVTGCLANAPWCDVAYGDQMGWAYAEYLAVDVAGTPLYIHEAPAEVEIAEVTFDAEATNAATLGAIGAFAGTIVGGPAAIAAGLVIGGAIGADATPDDQVIAYVADNPSDPVFLQGEVVVGAKLPNEVALTSVPGTDYTYANVNGQNVIVDAEGRDIIYIPRS